MSVGSRRARPSLRIDRFERPTTDGSRWAREFAATCMEVWKRYQKPLWSVDTEFLAFLESLQQFGFFRFGPVVIDVGAVEAMYSKDLALASSHARRGKAAFGADFIRFTKRLMRDVERSGRRLDELHYLLTFMRTPEGIPARVFGKLGVSADQVEQFARGSIVDDSQSGLSPERLYTIGNAAAYYGVHAQTVRGWIRSGRLPAVRLAGQKVIRIRERDLPAVLAPFKSKTR